MWYLGLEVGEAGRQQPPLNSLLFLGYLVVSLRGRDKENSVAVCLVPVKAGSRLVCVTSNQEQL